MELVHHMKEQLAIVEQNLIIVNGKTVVKKRPGGIQLKCLHMYANNVILKMSNFKEGLNLPK